jgi:hypothetical protein
MFRFRVGFLAALKVRYRRGLSSILQTPQDAPVFPAKEAAEGIKSWRNPRAV